MNIVLSGPFTNSGVRDERDIRQMKKALNRLGFYQPKAETGITGAIDPSLFEALKAYQRARQLPATGRAAPDDATIRHINVDMQKRQEGNYIWRTVGDDKVRPEHAKFKDTIRAWSDALDPGDDYNCRCWAESLPHDLPITPVYPELLLVPLAGRLYSAWRLWINAPYRNWQLGSHKSTTTWGNQIKNRNWTPKEIEQALKYGKRYPAPNKINPDNKAVLYDYKGRYIVRDEITGDILQIGKPNFEHPSISKGYQP